MKLKKNFPNDWEIIIKGNCMADHDAKNAKYKYPEHKLPPSAFGSNIILETKQGEIIQSNFKMSLNSRLTLNDRLIYKNKKAGQNPFSRISCYSNTKKYDKMLMKDSSFKVANLQNFLFKVR